MKLHNPLFIGLLTFIVTLSGTATAQTPSWFETGHTWIYNYQAAFNPGHYQAIFAVTEQTQFAGKECAKVEVVSENPHPFPCSAVQPPYYFYTSGDSVFYASENDGVFHLAYDFGAEVDDTWEYIVPVQEPWLTETFVDTFEARVVSTSLIEVEGHSLRRLELSSTHLGSGDPYSTLFGEGNLYVLEFMGGENGFIVPFGDYMVSSVCDGSWGETLQCFESASLNYLNPLFDSCVLDVAAPGDEVVFALYPNPAQDHITIRAEGAGNVMGIYDLSGRRVAESRTFGPQLDYDVSRLSPGTYVVKLHNSRTTVSRLMVKE